ncbi:MAG: ThuA domain-containing protein [Chloroflexi bacterium]|nr:ThuA domain-containing protein [Chloroflexota bacterium]
MDVLVISGGRHPYQESTPILADFLQAGGHQVQVTENSSFLLSERLAGYDIILFNTRREAELTLNKDEQMAMTRFIGGGKGFVCLHISCCRPESWSEYHDVTGGGWVTGTSSHPPYGQFTVTVSDPSHPCTQGIREFITNDELYTDLSMKEGNQVFLTAEHNGEPLPMAWTRKYGNGRVFNTVLGHDGLSFQTEAFQQLVLNGVDWAGTKD